LELISQHIDDYGKLRNINCKYQNNIFTIFILPSQPLNLPKDDNVYTLDENIIIDLFGPPVKIEIGKYLYNILDFDSAISIPYVKENNHSAQINEYRIIKRNLDILMQLINWLWRSSKLKFKDFSIEYIFLDKTQTNSCVPPKGIRRKLPDISENNIKDGISYLNTFWPTYFNNKICLNPDLYNNVVVWFEKYEIKTRGCKPDSYLVNPRKYILTLYTWESDFIKYDDSLLFIKSEELEKWLLRINDTKSIQIYNKLSLDISFTFTSNPYIYRKQDNLYIIQNAKFDNINLERVVTICLDWKNGRTNKSFNAEPHKYKLDVYPHIIYAITKSFDMEPIEDNSDNDSEPLEILAYNYGASSVRYAAVLKLL